MSTSKSQGDDARVNSVRENSTMPRELDFFITLYFTQMLLLYNPGNFFK